MYIALALVFCFIVGGVVGFSFATIGTYKYLSSRAPHILPGYDWDDDPAWREMTADWNAPLEEMYWNTEGRK